MKYQKLGNQIKKLRNKKSLTQSQLAEKAHISKRTVQRLEKGNKVEKETILSLANALNVEVQELTKFVDNKKTNKQRTVVLNRINNGTELFNVIGHAEMFEFSNDEPKSSKDVDLISEFAQYVQDLGDIWSEIDMGNRVKYGQEISQLINKLETRGYLIFGVSYPRKMKFNGQLVDFNCAKVDVLRKGNPSIIRKNFKQKEVN